MAEQQLPHDASKARIELCQWAAINPDGTHTIVRGGLDHWTARLPLDLLLWALMELPKGLAVGAHKFELQVLNPDGAKVAGAEGMLQIGSERRTMFALPLQWSAQSYGTWRIRLLVENVSGEVSLDIRRPAESN